MNKTETLFACQFLRIPKAFFVHIYPSIYVYRYKKII